MSEEANLKTKEELQILKVKKAREALWRKGDLTWKLEPHQKFLYDCYQGLKEKQQKIGVWLASRRTGKTFSLLIIAIEECLKRKNTRIKYLCGTERMATEIVDEILPTILSDCPKSLRPEKVGRDNAWVFKHNGSRIQLKGSDRGGYQRLRGGSSHLCVVDEAGFIEDDLKDAVYSVLLPTTLTTGGKVLLSSTPPKIADHDFIDIFMKEAEEEGNLTTLTIDDYFKIWDEEKQTPKRFTRKDIREIIQSMPGGVKSEEYRREYLCELITSDDIRVIPEMTPDIEPKIVVEHHRPKFYNAYVGMDIGGTDFTAVVFAYYDFLRNKIVFEDELILKGKEVRLDTIANGIIEKEESLWFDPVFKNPIEPRKRVSDVNNPILINDLRYQFRINFDKADKKDADGARNEFRALIQSEEILIHPRCTNLIGCLKHAKWNKAKTSYTRNSTYGHYDALDAAIMVTRVIERHLNPYPKDYSVSRSEDMYFSEKTFGENEYSLEKTVEKMFRLNKLKRNFPKRLK